MSSASNNPPPVPPRLQSAAQPPPLVGHPADREPAPPSRHAPQAPRFNAPLTLKDWLLRVFMVGLLAGSGFLVWWSYQRLLPVQKEAREQTALLSRLGNDIRAMEFRYPQENIDKIRANYRAAQGLLFTGDGSLNNWFETLQADLLPLALEAKATFGQAKTTQAATQSLAVVRATVAVDLKPEVGVSAVKSPYARLLRFVDLVNRQAKRVDLVDLQVTGGTNSVAKAAATLDLWAGGEGKQ